MRMDAWKDHSGKWLVRSALISSSATQTMLADQSLLNNCIKYLQIISQVPEKKND